MLTSLLTALGVMGTSVIKNITNQNKTTATPKVTTIPTGSTQMNIYDPSGSKLSGYAVDGKAYLSDGSRIPTGYTAETKGGLFTMGQDGKGVKVDSIPKNVVTGNVKNTANNSPYMSPEVVRLLQGSASGKTAGELGYNAFYKNNLDDLQSRYDNYSSKGNQEMANHYLDAINRFKDEKSAYNLHNTAFKDWDTGLLQRYIQNKNYYELLNMTTENTPYYDQKMIDRLKSQVPYTKEELESMNRDLRNFYGMTEDNYTYNDLGQLGADLLWGDFIKYGLDKEKGRDIPAIGSTNEDVDPKFRMAEMLARRDRLFGYEPLGQIKSINGEPFEPDYSGEERLLNAIMGKSNETVEDLRNERSERASSNSNYIPIYDIDGNKLNGIMKNGKPHLADGTPLPMGYTTEESRNNLNQSESYDYDGYDYNDILELLIRELSR